MKTICLNFYAGPGAGKSTIASAVFSELKKRHINCELITEFAKRKVWEGNYGCLENQLYITAKQQYLMWTVSKHVNLIITDSPLLLGSIYGNDDLLNQIIFREYRKFHNIDVYLTRNPKAKYQSNGRMQTHHEAIIKDNEIKTLLGQLNPQYSTFVVNHAVVDNVVNLVLPYLGHAQDNWFRRLIKSTFSWITSRTKVDPLNISANDVADDK